MKLQNLTVIFIIIVLPVILLTSFYISTGLKTIRYQALYDTGLITATQDAIQAFEINTLNNKYADNPETKRSIIKSSIKMLETSLCNTCNISSYNTDEIEEYIPAIMFGMYDGFYLYAPSLNPTNNKYEHSLKNYVYYSETLDEDNGIIIRYYLDSYVHVSGKINGEYQSEDGEYQSEEGYLININKTEFYNQTGGKVSFSEFNRQNGKIKYYNTEIDMKDELAVNYFIDNYKFSHWFLNVANIDSYKTYLDISESNDPEDPDSAFVQHRNEIIKNKIEGVLNSTITAYSERTWGQNYKMPELSQEDWDKIYSDISVTTFFQGKKIGLTKYNGYCVLNSNNHYELINPNLLYFSTDNGGAGTNIPNGVINTTYDYYHDIRCTQIPQQKVQHTAETSTGISTVRGWKIGRFQKIKNTSELRDGIEAGTTGSQYTYERAECACYECINGSVGATSVYDYIEVATGTGTAETFIKESYWTSLARERAKYHQNLQIPSDIDIEKTVNESTVIDGASVTYTITVTNEANKRDYITIEDKCLNGEIGDIKNIRYNIYDKNGNFVRKVSQITDTDKFNQSCDGITCNEMTWRDVSIESGEKIEIIYEAKVKDNNSDHSIKNEAFVYAEGIQLDQAEAICNTLDSNLAITKTVKQNDSVVSSVEYGSKVRYEITIKNNASLPDKINIKDAFYKNQITLSGNVTTTRNIGSGTIKDDVVTIGVDSVSDTSRNWYEVDIASGETITISYEAILTANIGQTITNTALVKSIYTGETDWDRATASCKIEKQINIKGNEPTGYNIILALDHSYSMYRNGTTKAKDLYTASYNFLNDIITKIDSEILNNTTATSIHFASNASTFKNKTFVRKRRNCYFSWIL